MDSGTYIERLKLVCEVAQCIGSMYGRISEPDLREWFETLLGASVEPPLWDSFKLAYEQSLRAGGTPSFGPVVKDSAPGKSRDFSSIGFMTLGFITGDGLEMLDLYVDLL